MLELTAIKRLRLSKGSQREAIFGHRLIGLHDEPELEPSKKSCQRALNVIGKSVRDSLAPRDLLCVWF